MGSHEGCECTVSQCLLSSGLTLVFDTTSTAHTDASSTKEKLDVLTSENRSSPSSLEDLKTKFAHIDEAKLIRKIDLRLIPVLVVLYVLAFLDRYVVGCFKYCHSI